jgi:8-amino-7-oxononanoate synthase
LAQQHGAALIVDEAHAIGVLGETGAGLVEELNLGAAVDIRIGTLGKALGVFGAFAAGEGEVIDLLVNRARTFVFSTALPPAICAAASRSVEIMRTEPLLRTKLRRNVTRFRHGMRELAVPTAPNQETPIFSVILGSTERALRAGRFVRDRGLFARPIRPPTVPEGTSRIRFSLSAAHEGQDIDHALSAMKELESIL